MEFIPISSELTSAERTIFRGKNEQDESDRYNLVDKAIHNPILEKPEDVAVAIWKAVKYQRSDMLVGSARLSKVAYQLFPGLMQSLYQRVLGMRARHYRQ
ncbi:MAG: hypothetical protein KME49_31455 [Brasilonema octagenarum HA4186-MV1]|jgi:hypothetical protein|nr:hypothetical protein [Brasilonema octagenarum HA4186-MV1]